MKVYLDNAGTTKPIEECLSKALSVATENYYNPSAKYHEAISLAENLKQAKNRILSRFPGYKAMFTSCGTESDNTAVFGFFKRGNGVTSLGEHSAVYQSFETLKQKGLTVRYAKLRKDGSVDVDDVLANVDENTTFLSVMHVNNETGAINDINEIAKKAKSISKKLVFHSDGVQAYGKLDYNLNSEYVDLYSASAHKIGALKGTGLLLYRNGLHVPPFVVGGGQEDGLRSGTENVLGILDFCYCSELAYGNLKENYNKVKELRDVFLRNVNSDKIFVVSSENSSVYVLSLIIEGLRGEVILHMLEDEGIIVGTGSACSSKRPHSRVLQACGYNSGQLDGVLRISFSPYNTVEEAEYAGEKLVQVVEKLYKVIYKK